MDPSSARHCRSVVCRKQRRSSPCKRVDRQSKPDRETSNDIPSRREGSASSDDRTTWIKRPRAGKWGGERRGSCVLPIFSYVYRRTLGSNDQGQGNGAVNDAAHVSSRYSVTYTEGAKVGYKSHQAEDRPTLFPFGFGLSYTTYEYSGMKVENGKETATVSFSVRNTGKRTGTEIAQVYAALPNEAGERYRRWLVGDGSSFGRGIEDCQRLNRSADVVDLQGTEGPMGASSGKLPQIRWKILSRHSA